MDIIQINEKLVNQIRKDIFYLIKKSHNTKNVVQYSVIISDIMEYIYLLAELGLYCDDIFQYIFPKTRKSMVKKSKKDSYIECEKTIDFDSKFIDNFGDILIENNYFHGNFEKMIEKVDTDKMYEMTFEFLDRYKISISNLLNKMIKEDRIILLKKE